MLSAGSSHLVLGRLGRTQSRSRPLKYPWYWGLNTVIGLTVIFSYFAKKHLFFCEILLWRLSTVYRYVCIPYELTYHSPSGQFQMDFFYLSKIYYTGNMHFIKLFCTKLYSYWNKRDIILFSNIERYLLLNSFQYKVSSD